MHYCKYCGKKLKEKSLFCSHCGKKIITTKKEEHIINKNNKDINSDDKEIYTRQKGSFKKGILWLTLPFAILMTTLFLWAIIQFIITSSGTFSITTIRVIRTILGLIGTVAVGGILVGIPLGIIYLSKRELKQGATYDEKSGKDDQSKIPEEIRKWNWGAAGLGWIWGTYHHVWISFLAFVPILNYVWWIVMGIKGNEWAWRKSKWVSVDEFLEKQRKWKPWGIAVFVIPVVLFLLGFLIGE